MELSDPDFRREGFFFDEATLKLDLYRLLSCFYASSAFERLRRRLDLDIRAAGELAGIFEESEVMHLLVSVAARVRMIQERELRERKKRHGSKKLATKLHCGRLIPDLTKPRNAEPLSIREACNKVIHAKRFSFDYSFTPRLPDDYAPIRPVVHLYGTKDQADWKARLDVVMFAAFCASRIREGVSWMYG